MLCVGASTAVADRPPQYFGVNGFDQVASEFGVEPDDGGEFNGDLWRLKLGYEFSKFLAAEVHYGFGDDASTGGEEFEVNLREAAAFGRFQLPYERLDVYFLAGVGRVGVSIPTLGRLTGEGPAAGLGVDFYGTENTAVTLEYVVYDVELEHDDFNGEADTTYDALTLGLTHHFEWPAFR
ncbi:MAG: outer membrane beta-barrel protein [Halofilum sp. (in: g-proteobacteria)]